MQPPLTVGDVTLWHGAALLLGLFAVGAGAALVAWVYRDARARGSPSPGGWALSVLSLPIPFLPWYLYRRSRSLDDRSSAVPTVDRLLATWGLGTIGAFAIGSVISPPDPFTQLFYTPFALVVTLPLVYFVVYPRWIR